MLTQARRERAFWRALLKRIARDMEDTAKTETDPKRRQWFESRARRVRQRLTRGMHDNWIEPTCHPKEPALRLGALVDEHDATRPRQKPGRKPKGATA